jgi:hypothetical protein
MHVRHSCLVLPLLVSALLAPRSVLQAQNAPNDTSLANAVALLRTNVRADKETIIRHALALPDSQANIFWPMYREYAAQAATLNDERVQLIHDYVTQYDHLTDAQAKSLVQRALDLDERRGKLARDEFDRFTKKLPAKTVAHFFQLEGFLNRVIELKILAALPEIQ